MHSSPRRIAFTALLFSAACLAQFQSAGARDHRVEPLDGPAPAEKLSPEIAKTLMPTGYQIIRGTSRTVCEIWLCKSWVTKQAEPAGGLIYPFEAGQLIGVIHYPRKGSDFRDQTIDEGMYTLRYGLQPVDGNHVGTSPTRDFLLLLKAQHDKSPATLNPEKLNKESATAVGTTHPGLLSLQRLQGSGAKPSMRHDEEHDWWILRVTSNLSVDGKATPQAIELVVAGQAAE